MDLNVTSQFALPEDGGLLVGRIWRPDLGGPSVVAIRDGAVFDITKAVPTMSELCNSNEVVKLARDGEPLAPCSAGSLEQSGDAARHPRGWGAAS